MAEEPLRAADGRVPGQRGRATRQRLLEATAAMLVTTSYRDLKVVDIARSAGTSPATFYQYFPDVEAAILLLARDMAEDGVVLADLAHGDWDGEAAYGTAEGLAQGFLDFWREHEAVLRVVDLAIVEGDRRFREIRNRLLNPVTMALRDEIAASAGDREAHPAAEAAVLVSMLAHVAEHRHGLEAWGAAASDARAAMARIIAWTITGTPHADVGTRSGRAGRRVQALTGCQVPAYVRFRSSNQSFTISNRCRDEARPLLRDRRAPAVAGGVPREPAQG